MRAFHLLFVPLFLPLSVCGQFEYGLSAGGVLTNLWVKPSDDFHVTGQVSNVGRKTFSASAYYRERYSEFVDLGFDLTLAHRSFNLSYGEYGLAGNESSTVRAELDQLYIGVKPEVRMDAKRSAVVRFGLMVGFRVGGSARGTYSNTVMGQGARNENADLTHDFGGDMRFALGFGFRVPMGSRWAITIDPEATIAFTSMLKADTGMRGTDIGLRIGLSRRSKGKALSSLFKGERQEREQGSI